MASHVRVFETQCHAKSCWLLNTIRSLILSGILVFLTAQLSAADNSTFPKINGLKFEINGVTKYYTGTNAYWLPFLMKNADIDTALDHIAGAGLKILRTWGLN